MKTYGQYKKDKTKRDLSKEELNSINWTKFKIVVPTEEDKQEIINAIEHIHHSDIDTNYVTVNQLAHEYLYGSNIVVDEEMYNKLNK